MDNKIGTDIIEINKIKESVNAFGDKYLKKIFTTKEIQYCMKYKKTYAQHLAARFAAKEAVIKILEPLNEVIHFKDIEIVRYSNGSCKVELHGNAKKLAMERNINYTSVSLSHEEKYAIAMVLVSTYKKE
ncbi:holo-ACP synthase [Priestia aryabhattai]|uniref:holo-ACP synthase n=1 Tax=Priestia aryabhattai TaxID=412384 RepID=UPI0031450826